MRNIRGTHKLDLKSWRSSNPDLDSGAYHGRVRAALGSPPPPALPKRGGGEGQFNAATPSYYTLPQATPGPLGGLTRRDGAGTGRLTPQGREGETPGVTGGSLQALRTAPPQPAAPRRSRRGHLARKAGPGPSPPRPSSGFPSPGHPTPTGVRGKFPGPNKAEVTLGPPAPPRQASPQRHVELGSRHAGAVREEQQRPPRTPLTCWPARGLPWGALLKKEVLAVKKKSSASSSRLL